MVEISVFLAFGLLCALLLWAEGLLKRGKMRVWAAFGVTLAMAVRWFLLPYGESTGAVSVAQWANFFRDNGSFGAMTAFGCPFPVGMRYLLVLFSWVEYPAIYLAKYAANFAEIVLAWSSLRLAARFTKKQGQRLAVFLLILLLPSAVIHSGYSCGWAGIWCSLSILSAERALAKKPWQAVFFWGLGLCFGAEACFLLPVFIIFLSQKKLRGYHFLLLPAVLSLVMLPALGPDRPLRALLTLLPAFTGVDNMPAFQGSPGIYAFQPEGLSPWFGIGGFAAFSLALVWWLCLCGKAADDRALLGALAFTGVSAGLLLPWMGAYSLYGAEVLLVILCVPERRMIPAAALCCATSLLSCVAALFGKILVPLRFGAVVLLAVLVLLTVYMYKHAYKRNR